MDIKLKQYLLNISNRLWFLPTIMATVSVGLAFGFIELDEYITYSEIPMNWFIYGGQREGALSVLSTIASSMVTIAGVSFSITLVALTMASSQFGPRLLRNFIADRGNQFVIGTFISTFIYSLIVLLAIRSSDDSSFVPKISVVFAFLLAIFSLGVVIYFIHHVSTSIQADYIIHSSFRDFEEIAREFLVPETEQTETYSPATLRDEFLRQNTYTNEVYFEESGFIQSIDYEGIRQWTEKHNVMVHLMVRPGDFVSAHQHLCTIYYSSLAPPAGATELPSFLVIGYQRTPNSDLLFSLKQIVEVGVRALSPGTNDPHTAISAIQWLGAALSIIAKRKLPSPVIRDKNGILRIYFSQISYHDIVGTCFDQMVLYGKNNIYVSTEIIKALQKPMTLTADPLFKKELLATARGIYEALHREEAHSQGMPGLEKGFSALTNAANGTK